MNNFETFGWIILIFILGIGVGYMIGSNQKINQTCVITVEKGESIILDNITRSDCSLFLGGK